ncbi:hypothetical protein [Rhodovulum steppense]|uniref:Uncharacterized protein n=1 Tax=Rhodovulum steppense TaxID=540251 RepID=A0A4R1YSN8_9RHOB|nr:hypothetical protein [Rhodovulum steppense]TCM82646.1 hypothetical protein EV216_1159 [Rhodovulum steppense]
MGTIAGEPNLDNFGTQNYQPTFATAAIASTVAVVVARTVGTFVFALFEPDTAQTGMAMSAISITRPILLAIALWLARQGVETPFRVRRRPFCQGRCGAP